MLGEVLKIGEKVAIQISNESREWGFNPASNGTVVEILSFGEITYGYTNNFDNGPGVFTNFCWANVRLPDGEALHLSTCHLDVCSDATLGLDKEEYDRRLTKLSGEWMKKVRLRSAPETDFWVGDIITDCSRHEYDHLYVVGINYDYIGHKRTDGSDMPLYEVSNSWPNNGWRSNANAEDLTLVARGNVWKYNHNEPMSFLNIEEEANFYSLIGRTRQVKCPTTNNYKWESKEQVLDAIQAGKVHAIALSGGMFGSTPFDSAYVYLDEEVGKRVAAHILKGFGR